jgi:hypothetical protein
MLLPSGTSLFTLSDVDADVAQIKGLPGPHPGQELGELRQCFRERLKRDRLTRVGPERRGDGGASVFVSLRRQLSGCRGADNLSC